MAELWRFPVKSMQGSRVERLEFDEKGAAGDRTWGVVDPAAGKVLSAKRWPALLQASAALDGRGTVTVTLPDGSHPRGRRPGRRRGAVGLARPRGRALQAARRRRPPLRAADRGVGRHLAAVGVPRPARRPVRRPGRRPPPHHRQPPGRRRRCTPTAPGTSAGSGPTPCSTSTATSSSRTPGSARPVGAGRRSCSTPFMPTVRCALPTRDQPGLPEGPRHRPHAAATHHDLNLGRLLRGRHAGHRRRRRPGSVG